MFCPKGYVPFSELCSNIYEFYEDAEFFLKSRTNHISVISRQRIGDVLHDWVSEFCRDNAFLSDGTDVIVRIDLGTLTSVCFNVDTTLEPCTINIEELFEEAPQLKEQFSICYPIEPEDTQKFMDHLRDNGDIPISPVLDKTLNGKLDMYLSDDRRTAPWLFIEHQNYTVSLDLYRYLVGKGEKTASCYIYSGTGHTAKLLERFEGMALCVSEDYVKANWDAFCKDIGARKTKLLESDKNEYNNGPCRPRRQADAFNAYGQIFPNGHRGLTWPQVIQALEDKAGVHISKDTLRRALGLRYCGK